MDAFCYPSWAAYNSPSSPGPFGQWRGYGIFITPGSSTVNSTWSCWWGQVYPGPYVRECGKTALSYS